MKTPSPKPVAEKKRADREPSPTEPATGPVAGLGGAPDEAEPDPAAESADWIPTTSSTALPTPEVGDDEEDDEGQNTSAQLVEEGVKRAEHQQILQAAKDASLDNE